MICNLVLEGGGAKGFAHVGAIKAIKDYGITIKGVAGTSAGAIAALLVACKYEPDDMYNPKTGNGIFPKNLLDILLGTKIDAFRVYIFAQLALIYVFFVSSLLLGSLLESLTKLQLFGALVSVIFVWLISTKIKLIKSFIATLILLSCVFLLSPLLLITLPMFWHFGLISTIGVKNWLINIVRESPAMSKHRRKNIETLTLGEFYKISGVDLKVVATDLTNQKIVAFSGTDPQTKDYPLVDAVVASMCIPILFKCCDIKAPDGSTNRYVDGGMLSNFPAWLHRKYVLMDDLHHTIGLSIKADSESNSARKIDTPLRYLSALIKTALWGRANIENISVKGLMKVPINTGNVTTLKFDLSMHERNELYCKAFEQTINALERDYSIFPTSEAKGWLKGITKLFRDFLLNIDVVRDSPAIELRSSLASFIDAELKIAKLIHTHNMDYDLDRHLEFDGEEGLTGLCLKLGLPLLHDVAKSHTSLLSNVVTNSKLSNRGGLHKNRQQLLAKKTDYILSIPIYCTTILERNYAVSATQQVGFEDIIGVDFSVVYREKIKPKAVLNIDISSDKASNEILNDVLLNNPVFKTLVSIYTAMGCYKINELSQFDRRYSIEY
ncbi:patatin-like phospholipase family protein [Vibrio campbellii]|uniref:patatin-like phospholipase family protein n=1 Tax=Vibrio campbellii TaxID=680 RepID=UPI004057B3D5